MNPFEVERLGSAARNRLVSRADSLLSLLPHRLLRNWMTPVLKRPRRSVKEMQTVAPVQNQLRSV